MHPDKAPLRRLATDLWVAERPQRFFGLEVGTRMTVIRLADGSLLLHSPVVLDPALRGESIEVRARGRGLELRGWLPSRSARSLAYRAARLAAESHELTNHLLVRGEDDLGRSGGKSDGRSDPSPLPSDSPRSA